MCKKVEIITENRSNTVPDTDERKRYWNEEYFHYWMARVVEANREKGGLSELVQNDIVTTSDSIYSELFKAVKFKKGNLLEVGCGWGRLFAIYAAYGMSIYGIDISAKMIEEARKQNIPELTELKESVAEDIPYESDFFDFVCCMGVFDATFQDKSLSEMMRVSKIGGKIIITGKNVNYFSDDKVALAAEKGAFQKGEPNFFTDVPAMIAQLKKQGHALPCQFYYRRRGDFSDNCYTDIIPGRFYEYFLVIQKKTDQVFFTPFSSVVSFTAKDVSREES